MESNNGKWENNEKGLPKPLTPLFGYLLHCEFSDPQLYKVIRLIIVTLAFNSRVLNPSREDKNISPNMFSLGNYLIEEESIREKSKNNSPLRYFYTINNRKLNRILYIGRDSTQENSPIEYIIQNDNRINWAIKEGFTLEEAYQKVGNLSYANSLSDAQRWIGGTGRECDIKLKRGGYLVGGKQLNS